MVRAVKRNIERFPTDFMFQLTKAEYEIFLRCQIGISKEGRLGCPKNARSMSLTEKRILDKL